MNERIKELAVQAGFQPYITTHEEDVAMFKKFAELLLQECADYIDVFNRENMVEEGIGGTELKQHFGVNE